MQKINGISGLRGFIAFIIVFYHLQQLRPIADLAPWDWALYQFFNMLPVVVVVFFILTGLLRSLAYWESIYHDGKTPAIRKVLVDRWWRIAPAYYVILMVSFGWSIYIRGFHMDMLLPLFSGFTFLNWISPMTFFPVSLNGPLWFVGYDMMGYIFTVFMMLGLTYVQKKNIYKTIIAYILLFLGLHYVFIPLPWSPGEGVVSVWFPYYNPFIFAIYSIMGIMIGGIITRYQNLSRNIFWDFTFFGSLLSTFVYLWIIRGAPDLAYSFPMSPYRFPIIPVLLVITIFALIHSKYLGIIIDNRFFLFLSSISYSLYLWHGLVIDILRTIVFRDVSVSFSEWVFFAITSVVISFVIATLNVRYIENCRGKKNKIQKIG